MVFNLEPNKAILPHGIIHLFSWLRGFQISQSLNIRVIRVIRGCLFLFHLRLYWCPFVVHAENRKKFSLNPV